MRMSDWSSDVCSSDLNIRSSVRSEYDAALAQENLLTSKLASLRTQTLDVDSRSIQYNILKREADTNRQLYDALLQRYKEIGVRSEARRAGKERVSTCSCRWSPYHKKTNRILTD